MLLHLQGEEEGRLEQEFLVSEFSYSILKFYYHFSAELINYRGRPCGLDVETSQS